MNTEPTPSPVTLDVCEEAVIAAIRKRREHGFRKYGVTVERTDIDLIGWVQHLQEELMDAAIYAERLKREAVGTYDAAKDAEIERLRKENDNLRKTILAQHDEIRALEGWKAGALAVESEWNAQAVGLLLKNPLGKSIRAHIEPAVRELIARSEELKSRLNNLVAAATPYHLNYSDAELVQLAACSTGLGEIPPHAAQKQIALRSAMRAALGIAAIQTHEG